MERRKFLGIGFSAFAVAALTNVASAAFVDDYQKGIKKEGTKEALKSVYGTSDTTESDKVELKVPDIAENGAAVPVTVSTSLPNVKTMSLIVEENPHPLIVAWEIPKRGIPEYSTRVRMGKTGNVKLVVETEDGKLYTANQEVKVTVGGCGG